MNNKEFVEVAQPHHWFMVADNLHEQATSLRKNNGLSKITLQHYDSMSVDQWDSTNRSVFLLCGFALENALKAFLVYENPQWISNGTLSKKLRSHSLTALSLRSNIAPYKAQSQKTLRSFEDGLESWARYPCALKKEGTRKEKILTEKLWKNYQWLISAYGNKLVRILQKEWSGPHGYSGRYRIQGEFLGSGV